MPVLKIFRGDLADKLYSEKEIIKTKSKDLRVKKTQMKICKRDMEELALAESLVQAAKTQMFALTEFEDFMAFIHDETSHLNIEAATLFSSINPEYTEDDKYTNLFAQFDYALNNTDNLEYKDEDTKEVKSLKEWYPYLYQKAWSEYYELYSEISVHQINIYKIANDAIGLVDIRRGEVDLVLSIAKEISENVSKLIDFATQKFGADSDKLNKIVNDLQEQEQQVRIEYKENLDEDVSIVPVIFRTEVTDLVSGSKELTIPFGHQAEIKITSNVTGSFTLDYEQYALKQHLIEVEVTTGAVEHVFRITNRNGGVTGDYTLNSLNVTFTPSDENHYSVSENYNILTTNGDAIDASNSNLICKLKLEGQVVGQITHIAWDASKTRAEIKYSNRPTEQHYYINATYDGVATPVSTEINKTDITAYTVEDTSYSYSYTTPQVVPSFYTKKGTYNLYYEINPQLKTLTPLRLTIY